MLTTEALWLWVCEQETARLGAVPGSISNLGAIPLPRLICLCCLAPLSSKGHIWLCSSWGASLTPCSCANSWYSHNQQNSQGKDHTFHLTALLKIIMESVIPSSMAAFDHMEETKKMSIFNQREKRKNMPVSHLSIIVLFSFPRRNSGQKAVWCFGFLI